LHLRSLGWSWSKLFRSHSNLFHNAETDSERRKTIAANFILCYDGKYKKKQTRKLYNKDFLVLQCRRNLKKVYTLVLKVTQTFVDFILYILKELACARSIERYLVYFHNTKRKSLYDDVTDFFFKDAGSHWLTGVLARKNLLNFFEYF